MFMVQKKKEFKKVGRKRTVSFCGIFCGEVNESATPIVPLKHVRLVF